MKHLLFVAMAFATLNGFTFSSGGNAKHGPLLVIDTSNANFDAVPDTGYAQRRFTLSNDGDSVLHIKQVRPSCGCTIASLMDSSLAPGQRTSLIVRLSAEQRNGNFYKDIYIASNSRTGANSWLKFYGHFVSLTQKIARNHQLTKQ